MHFGFTVVSMVQRKAIGCGQTYLALRDWLSDWLPLWPPGIFSLINTVLWSNNLCRLRLLDFQYPQEDFIMRCILTAWLNVWSSSYCCEEYGHSIDGGMCKCYSQWKANTWTCFQKLIMCSDFLLLYHRWLLCTIEGAMAQNKLLF